jgi:hypothetical protein
MPIELLGGVYENLVILFGGQRRTVDYQHHQSSRDYTPRN